MPYRTHAKIKESSFSVVVETANDALAKLAEKNVIDFHAREMQDQ